MTDPTIDTTSVDMVPEADQLDQNLEVTPDEPEFDAPTVDREAAEADLIEQAIPVPLDDEYDEPEAGY
ncbi:hypothetical protein [Nocardia africana]|uniref:Uncharacterized protein n=1 Tax=Nocardia africana TaxID=134964 RepID=A0A378X485_9NOCA|nr:hypothetical protein [Nocardia africana]MCC3317483.1 hypothetical protein [Nocardia africana]SUA48238.1 Uncharacterised protein [Nocardia africana]